MSEQDHDKSSELLVGKIRGYTVCVERTRSKKGDLIFFIVLLFLLVFSVGGVLSGCAHTENKDWVNTTHRPTRYAMHVTNAVDVVHVSTRIIKAAEYWGLLGGGFVFVAVSRNNTYDWLIRVDAERPDMCSGLSVGCMDPTTRVIWISPLETGNLEYFESIVRHELGHVLGLDHAPGWSCEVVPSLMCAVLVGADSRLHPLDVTETDVEALRGIHPRRVWRSRVNQWEL